MAGKIGGVFFKIIAGAYHLNNWGDGFAQIRNQVL